MKRLFYWLLPSGDTKREVFLKNESKALIGKGGRNLRLLFYFLLLAFFAVSFAHSAYNYLQTRMDNPYLNWITFPRPINYAKDEDSGREKTYKSFKEELERLQEEGAFSLEKVGGLNRFPLRFLLDERKITGRVKGRTFAWPADSALLTKVLEPENLANETHISANPKNWTSDQRKRGIILSEALVNNNPCAFADEVYAYDYSEKLPRMVPIAVVKSLPNQTQFMVSHTYLVDFKSDDFVDVRSLNSVVWNMTFLEGEGLSAFDTQSIIKYGKSLGLNVGEPIVSSIQDDCQFTTHVSVSFAPSNGSQINKEDYEAFKKKVLEQLDSHKPYFIEDNMLSDLGTYSQSNAPKETKPGSDYQKYSSFAVLFSEADSIRAFRNYLFEKEGVEISLEEVEARENFELVQVLTAILAITLSLFTLISITLFITSILKGHLDSIRMNLGTFIAFGMSDLFLLRQYSRLTMSMLTCVVLVVYFILLVMDVFSVPYYALVLFGVDLKPDFKGAYTLASSWLLLLTILIIFATWLNCRRMVKRKLLHPPSDLINNRTQ